MITQDLERLFVVATWSSSCYNLTSLTEISLKSNRPGHCAWSTAEGIYLMGGEGRSDTNFNNSELVKNYGTTESAFKLKSSVSFVHLLSATQLYNMVPTRLISIISGIVLCDKSSSEALFTTLHYHCIKMKNYSLLLVQCWDNMHDRNVVYYLHRHNFKFCHNQLKSLKVTEIVWQG